MLTRRLVVATVVVAALLAAAVVALFLRVNSAEVAVLPASPSPAPAVTSPPATTAPAPAPTTAAPTTPPATAVPTATATPTARPEGDVAAYQQVLADLGYYVGPVDGEDGSATRSAVVAFQKVNGLVADGDVGPVTLAALAAPRAPQLRGGAPDRIEVDLSLQVLHLVADGELVRTVPVSSGSGERYTTASGGSARSLTPVGTFTVERTIRGVREAPLGTLYDPMYFYRGWAIHGSNSVPSYPASHGCVRVTRVDALWLFERAPVGTAVVLHGGEHAFSPSAGESAGTDVPAGDTPDTIVPDPIMTPTAEPSPTPSAPPPAPAPPPPAPAPAPPPPPPAPPPPAPPAPPPPPTPPASPSPSEPTPPAPDPSPRPTGDPATTSSGARR